MLRLHETEPQPTRLRTDSFPSPPSSMSTLRERKAISAFASAQAAADAADQSDAMDADAAIMRAAASSGHTAAASSHVASAASVSASAGSPLGPSWIRFIPFAFLFMLVFLSVSLLTTGTLHYGLEPALRPHMKQWQRSFTNAQINLQEKVGLREPAAARQQRKQQQQQQQQQRAANTGYGGVTPKKKKGSTTSQAASTPPVVEEEVVYVEPRPLERDPHALYLTPEQLSLYDGRDGGPVFLAVYGRIFDVSEGRQHYGPDGSYSNLAGRDASRAFATNCYRNQGLADLRGLTPEQLKGIDHWYKFYNTHEKYRPVGWVEAPLIPEDTPMPNDEC